MTTSRRDLLRFAALGAAAGSFASLSPLRAMCGRSFAATTADKLLVVFLRGAMDALYTVAPIGDPDYDTARTGLKTPLGPTPYLLNPSGFAALSSHWSVLTQPGGPLANGHARFILQIGNPEGMRSHFDEWEILERALLPNGFHLSEDGVFARLAKQAAFANSLPLASVGPNLQRWFRSPDLVAAHVKSLAEYDLAHEDSTYAGVSIAASMAGFEAQTLAAMTAHYGQPAPTTPPAAQAHGVGDFVLGSEAIVSAMTPTHDPAAFPTDVNQQGSLPNYAPGFAIMKHCEDAIQLLEQTPCSVAGVDIHGWDTHVQQASQRALLDQWVAKALDSVYRRALQLSAAGHPTTVLVVTEFGRTNLVNGNLGTDHGVGGWMLAMGTTVNGSIAVSNCDAGNWKPLLQPSANPKWGNALEVKTDFRTVLRELFRKRFQLASASLTAALPQPPLAGFDQPLNVFV